MAFTTFPSVGPYAPETLTADLNTNFGKTIEASLATVADGEFLVYDGSSSVWINRTAAEAGIPSSVADLGDVTIATVADGEFMIYDGSSASWINATAAEAGIPDNLEDLTNVSVATPADGDVLTYDGSSGTWINGTGSAGDLAGLTDTSIATPAEGEVLTYDGSSGAWINATAAAGSSTLADLTDTSIATPADGDVLTYDGSSGAWINATGGGAATFQGASVTLSADSAETATDVNVGFDTELFDTDSIHDNVTNNSRLTVPTGWTKVELGYTLHVINVTNALDIQTGILKNGTLEHPNNAIQNLASRFASIRSSGATGPIAVTGGDYFQLTYYSGGDTSTTIDASKTGFWMRRLE